MIDWTFPLFSFLAVLLLIPPARLLAFRLGYVDEPGGRKQHDTPVPPIGGLVIFPIFIVFSIIAGFNDDTHFYFYIALMMVVLTGAIDDHGHVPAWIKFFMQIAAAGFLVWAGPAHVHQLGNLLGLGNLGLDFMAIPFSMAAIVLLINAVNLMDGLDGLAGGQALVALTWLIVTALVEGQPGIAEPVAILAAPLFAFLIYNMRHPFRKKASIFLGDAGSLGLGLCLAWFCIDFAQTPNAVLKPISVAWILALPIIDVCAQFYRRVLEGRHPFDPDRGHFHHHLIHAGFSVRGASLFVCVLGIVFGLIGYGAYRIGVPEFVLTFLWTALLLIHMRLSRAPQNYINFFSLFTHSRAPVDN